MKRLVGVCSWSLRPATPEELVQRVRACGLGAVQLALDPIRRREPGWEPGRVEQVLRAAGIRIASGMMGMKGEDYSTLESIRRTGGVRVDANWPENLAAAKANAQIARLLGIRLVTFHAGFLPRDRDDPERRVMVDRLRQLIEVFAGEHVAVAFETGQETAETLESVLMELDPSGPHGVGGKGRGAGEGESDGNGGAGANFDPANMILYGMGDPIAALRRLLAGGREGRGGQGGLVRQVHIKDAVPSTEPGQWGREVPVGQGAVDWPAFFAELNRANPACDLLIEREAGADRIADIQAAAAMIRSLE